MMYKVTRQYAKGKEIPDHKKLSSLNEAKKYMQECAEADAAMKVATLYRLYELDEMIYEVDSAKIVPVSAASSESSGSAGKSSSASFRPTPLSTTPRPKGSPQNWVVDPDEDNEK